MDRAFLVIASGLGFLGVAFGAFGTHALQARLSPDRLSQFETGVRYQLWHALALFAVIFVWSLRPFGWTSYSPLLVSRPFQLWPALAGWLFVAGVVLFSGSLYALALTGNRRWAALTPLGGLAFLLGWLALLIAIITI
ncbi:MAG TPA: DUF423 domain-containing protein [Actinomycetota bacterium]|nr:DUF423 domain-containing protein [Actinomycetota bacterium]